MKKNFYKGKKILLTGGAGFLGGYVLDALLKKGALRKNIFIPRSLSCDLKKIANVRKVVKGKDIVIHLAGVVGGIGFNQALPGTMAYDNLQMGLNIFEEARKAGVEKLTVVGTVCAYPKITPLPFSEKNLWNGYPEETNAPYGLAKKMLLVLSQAYRRQYGFNSIFLIPANLYGPGDNFNPQSSHVIPALIRKIDQAKKQGKKSITVWGTGKATREFLYAKDCARAIVMATEKYNKSDPVNIGSGKEISIKDLVRMIAKLARYQGQIVWDSAKPDGQPKRRLNVAKAKKEFGFKAKKSFKLGLTETINYYHKKNS